MCPDNKHWILFWTKKWCIIGRTKLFSDTQYLFWNEWLWQTEWIINFFSSKTIGFNGIVYCIVSKRFLQNVPEFQSFWQNSFSFYRTNLLLCCNCCFAWIYLNISFMTWFCPKIGFYCRCIEILCQIKFSSLANYFRSYSILQFGIKSVGIYSRSL